MKLNCCLTLILLVSVCIFSTVWVSAQGDTDPGNKILNQREAEVTKLKQKVEENHNQQCELLRTCGTPMTCSRNSCWPLKSEVGHRTCQTVKNNTYCPNLPSACPSKYFDFTRSYVRVAPTSDTASQVTAATICSHKELDPVFKEVCNQTSLSRAFLGTVDGTYIHFPGSDQSKDDCKKYDPRLRPWYRTSTSVQKAVMVLVDAGEFMGTPLPAPLEGTILNVTRAIVGELLNTLSPQDHVNIITFDSSKATSLTSSPVLVEHHDTKDSTFHPEFDGLKVNLSNMTIEKGAGQKPSNLTLGITEALRNYAPDGVPGRYNSSMKIIIVFTDGNAATLKDGALADLVGKNVKVFIFKLPRPDDTTNPFLTGSLFLSQLSSMGGSFNIITSEAKNPLYAIQPYFSFLAKFRVSINDAADYSNIYNDFEQIVDNIFSITKPAFAPDGQLLGIVGLNIFMDGLGANIGSVTNALMLRNGGKAFDPTKFVLSAANASIQVPTQSNTAQPCGSSIPTLPDAGLCAQTDFDSTIQNLACCNACPPPPSVPSKINVGTKIGIGVGVVATILAVLLLIYVVRRHKKDRHRPVFPAPPPVTPRPASLETSDTSKPSCS